MRNPVDIVDEQIRAYRARDAAAFAACYEEDAVCAVLGSGECLARGRAEIEARWGADFRTGLDSLEITDRLLAGRFVVDVEQVRFEGQAMKRAVAIYETGPEQIRHVWFVFDPDFNATGTE